IARYAGEAGSIPKRNFLRVPHDASHAHSGLTLRSEHLTSVALPKDPCQLFSLGWGDQPYSCYLTSMDYFGYWRPTLAAAYEAIKRMALESDYSPYCSTDSAIGTCAKTRDMGVWRDGIPATPMKNASQVPELQTRFPDYCSR